MKILFLITLAAAAAEVAQMETNYDTETTNPVERASESFEDQDFLNDVVGFVNEHQLVLEEEQDSEVAAKNEDHNEIEQGEQEEEAEKHESDESDEIDEIDKIDSEPEFAAKAEFAANIAQESDQQQTAEFIPASSAESPDSELNQQDIHIDTGLHFNIIKDQEEESSDEEEEEDDCKGGFWFWPFGKQDASTSRIAPEIMLSSHDDHGLFKSESQQPGKVESTHSTKKTGKIQFNGNISTTGNTTRSYNESYSLLTSGGNVVRIGGRFRMAFLAILRYVYSLL